MATTLRAMDNAADNVIAAYLEKNFYPRYTENYIRYNDRENQMAGIDVQFDYNELTGILVDEKALTHYVNKNLPTFAFEINFLSTTKAIIPGWFYDESKKTQYYLMSWIEANKERDFRLDDIKRLDTLLINRERIQSMLSEYGMNKEIANIQATEIRKNNITGVSDKDLKVKPYYFVYSTHLEEAPINLVVRKEKLIEIATARFDLTPM